MPSDSLAWAGFVDTTGLEIVDVHEESGIDTLVQFVVRGSSSDIDRALAAARFSEPFKPGAGAFQPPLSSFDVTKLKSPRSAEDWWKNPDGKTIDRQVVRGVTGDGTEVVHVSAFTIL